MDRRRCSPKVWQDLGIIPAPENENEYKILNMQAYIDMVNQTKDDAMLRLFHIMTLDQLQLLDEIDVLNRERLSDVELCRVIDNATHVIAKWYRAGLRVHQLLINNQKRMIRSCLEIAICQIVLMIVHNPPLMEITEWESCVGVIASFAALLIILDLFDDETFFIPDNIFD